jgi:peptide/nickel transport system substrate-binding protein
MPSDDDVRRLLAACDGPGFLDRRDRALLLVRFLAARSTMRSPARPAARRHDDGHARSTQMSTRRELLKSALGASVVLLAPACAQPPGAPAAVGTKRGGELVVSIAEDLNTLDPAKGINAAEYSVTSWLYDNLTYLGPDLQLRPSLASSWEPGENGKVWTFKLRQGAKFSHGRELTSADVVHTFKRILDPATASPGRTDVGPIETIDALDKYTVRFTLATPFSEFPAQISQRWGRIVPADKGEGDTLKMQAFGSGPYVLKEHVPGSHITVTKNPDHWNSDAGLVDAITLRRFPDRAAEISAFQNGQTHIMFEVPSAAFRQVSGMQGVKVLEVPSGTWIPMIMRVDTKPFDDVRVRQAIKYAVDRQQLVQAVLGGRGTPANDHNVPPNHPFAWVSDVRKRDVAKAKQLLRDAGHPNGFEFELVAATDRPARADLAVAISQMVKEAGIDLRVKTIDYNTYIAQVYKKGPLYIGYWGMRPTLDGQLYPFFTAGGSWNEYAYDNPGLKRTLEDARAALDTDARKRLYQRAQETLSDDGPALISIFTNYITAHRDNVRGYQAHPLTWMDHLRFVSLS